MRKFKRFLYLYFGNYKWARKFIGGRWILDKDPYHDWVSVDLGFEPLKLLPWPPNEKQFYHEEYK